MTGVQTCALPICGIANPLATFGAVGMLLAHLGEHDWSRRVAAAIRRTLIEGPLTPDLGGDGTTATVTARVLSFL